MIDMTANDNKHTTTNTNHCTMQCTGIEVIYFHLYTEDVYINMNMITSICMIDLHDHSMDAHYISIDICLIAHHIIVNQWHKTIEQISTSTPSVNVIQPKLACLHIHQNIIITL